MCLALHGMRCLQPLHLHPASPFATRKEHDSTCLAATPQEQARREHAFFFPGGPPGRKARKAPGELPGLINPNQCPADDSRQKPRPAAARTASAATATCTRALGALSGLSGCLRVYVQGHGMAKEAESFHDLRLLWLQATQRPHKLCGCATREACTRAKFCFRSRFG